MRIETEDGKVYYKNRTQDPFYRFLIMNNCLRESCYNCPSRGLKRRADITLGDYWGVEKNDSDLVDGNDISLVLLHTPKGIKAFENIKESCSGHQVDFDKAISGNPVFFVSCDRPEERSLVERDIDDSDFETLFFKYGLSRKGRIKYLFLKFLRKDMI